METKTVYSRIELQKKLIELKEDGFKQREYLSEYLDNMLFYIGDQDANLRDKIIYTMFSELICNSEYLDYEKLKNILHVVLDDEHLFYQIGNTDDYTVLTRSFSVLVVALLLNRNRTKPFMSEDEFVRTKNLVFKYFESEKDYRGYNEKFGWIHAIAHCADALDEIVLTSLCTHEDCQTILNLGAKVFTNSDFIFNHEEDERFVSVIISMREKELISLEELEIWKESLVFDENFNEYSSFISRMNGKQLWRSLYFKNK